MYVRTANVPANACGGRMNAFEATMGDNTDKMRPRAELPLTLVT